MGAIDLPAEVPAERASDQRIGREMLLRCDASHGDRRSHAVRQQLGERTRIFVGQDAGDGPGNCRMLGSEGSASLEKRAIPVVLQWPGALRSCLEEVGHCGAVDCRLAG